MSSSAGSHQSQECADKWGIGIVHRETGQVSSNFPIYWLSSCKIPVMRPSRLSLTTALQSDPNSLPILPKNMETRGGSARPASQLGNVGAGISSPPRAEVRQGVRVLSLLSAHFSVGLVMVPPRMGMALIIAPCVRDQAINLACLVRPRFGVASLAPCPPFS